MDAGLPRWQGVKNPLVNAGDAKNSGWISASGRSSGRGNGNPLQYSYLGNPTDREAWWVAVHRVPQSWTRLSTKYAHFPLILVSLNAKPYVDCLRHVGISLDFSLPFNPT